MISKSALAVLCLSLASLCILKVKAQDGVTTEVPEPTTQRAPQCNTLYAAFTYNGVHYFVYGTGYGMMTGVNFKGYVTYHMNDAFDTGFTYPITAGAGIIESEGHEVYYLYSGQVEFVHPKDPNGYDLYPLHYSGAKSELLKTRSKVYIDAAYTGANSTITYFEGCDYIRVDAYNLRVEGQGMNFEANLPCDIDAAWRSPDFSEGYIVKGDKLYVWREGDAKAQDPVDLFSFFPVLRTFNLCSS